MGLFDPKCLYLLFSRSPLFRQTDFTEVNFYSKHSLTGFTPENHDLEYINSMDVNGENNENTSSSIFNGINGINGSRNKDSNGTGFDRDRGPESGCDDGLSPAIRQAESMHLACKALLLLVRHRGGHLKARTALHCAVSIHLYRPRPRPQPVPQCVIPA